MDCDVAVVGAGPSGLTAARILADRGLRVVVFDKKPGVGEQVVCTGIVGREAFDRYSLPRDSILREFRKLTVISPLFSSAAYEHPEPFAFAVDRRRFDRSLMRMAENKGARIQVSTEVLDVVPQEDSVSILVRTQGAGTRRCEAAALILATGINYNLHKKLGLGVPKNFLYGAQAEIATDAFDSTHVYVGKDIAPGAFAWVVPTAGGRARVGLMTESEPEEKLRRLIRKCGVSAEDTDSMTRPPMFRAIAQGLVSPTYADRILTVGEAAGQVKTTTGGGIYYGMLGAETASAVVSRQLARGDLSRRALSEYERNWKQAIRREILIGYYARKLWSNLSDRQIENLFQLAKNDGVAPYIRNQGEFDWHSDFILKFMKKSPFAAFFKLTFPFSQRKN